MNKLLTIFFIFATAIMANAQIATLSGTVTSKKSGSPLIAATVTAGKQGTITELDGSFKLALPAGEYQLSVSYVGFETHTRSITLGANEVKTIEVSLEESLNLLQTATVTSGKHEVALGEVTVSLDVIKPSLIESTNQTSLDGLLEKVAGVTMVGDQANIRGGSGFSYGAGSRVLLLIDDMPIYQADAGFPQWEDVPLENVEQVEVVKGAASALYGSSALNGIVNVRTAYAKSKPETYFAPYITVFGAPKNEANKWWDETPYTTGFNAAHRRKIGKFDLVLGSNYYRSNSFNDSTMSRRGRISVNTRYRMSDRLTFGINSNFNKSKGSSFFYWKGLGNLYEPGVSVSNSENFRFNIDPYLTYFDPSNNRHKILTRFFSVNNETGNAEADQSNISDFYYGEYQFQKKLPAASMVLTAGIVYNGTKVRAPLYGDTTFTSRNLAGYMQLEKKFFEKLSISAGFRYENNIVLTPDSLRYESEQIVVAGSVPNGEIKESKPVFRLGTSYQVGGNSFLRASWGQGYRFPTIAEKFIFTVFGGLPITPNFDLNSETGWTAEIGFRKGFQVSSFAGFFDIAGFWSEYEDMMEFSLVRTPISFQSQNIGDTRIKGFEVSVNGRGNFFGLETTLLAGYTYIDPKFKEFDITGAPGSEALHNAQNSSVCALGNTPECQNILKYRNRHTAKLDIESRYRNFSFGVAAQYLSFMENIDAIFEVFLPIELREFRQSHKGGDLTWGFRTAYYISSEIKASFLVNNALNREYSTRPGKLEGPRNYTVRLDFNF